MSEVGRLFRAIAVLGIVCGVLVLVFVAGWVVTLVRNVDVLAAQYVENPKLLASQVVVNAALLLTLFGLLVFDIILHIVAHLWRKGKEFDEYIASRKRRAGGGKR